MITDPELSSRYWIVRKAVCLVGYFGGLRNIELRSIEFGKTFPSGEKSFEENESGFWFCFERGKQRGLPQISTFCVPRRQEDWPATVSSSDRSPVDYDPASVLDHYLSLVELDLKRTKDQLTGGFFKSAHGKGARTFRQVPMGKNLIEKVGKEMAEELFLPNPATYTSHCWRRSCGTNSSDADVNVTTLMSHLGWTTPKTAIGYVQKSRMTSFNMAMLLSNVQRQNKDLDKVFDLLKTVVSNQEEALSGNSKVPVKQKKPTKTVPKSVPIVDEKLEAKFSRHLSNARKSESVARTHEMQLNEAENSTIVSAINDSLVVDERFSPQSEVVENLGSGGGEVLVADERVVSGGGVAVEALPALDPRVSSVLSSIRHQGELHVHFHFK
jgi:hypothetical protein